MSDVTICESTSILPYRLTMKPWRQEKGMSLIRTCTGLYIFTCILNDVSHKLPKNWHTMGQIMHIALHLSIVLELKIKLNKDIIFT